MEVTVIINENEMEAFMEECKNFRCSIIKTEKYKTGINVTLNIPAYQSLYGIGVMMGYMKAEKIVTHGTR